MVAICGNISSRTYLAVHLNYNRWIRNVRRCSAIALLALVGAVLCFRVQFQDALLAASELIASIRFQQNGERLFFFIKIIRIRCGHTQVNLVIFALYLGRCANAGANKLQSVLKIASKMLCESSDGRTKEKAIASVAARSKKRSYSSASCNNTFQAFETVIAAKRSQREKIHDAATQNITNAFLITTNIEHHKYCFETNHLSTTDELNIRMK